MTEPMPWINTTDYSTAELAFFSIGGVVWVIAYLAVLWGIHKNKFVEIPIAAVTANIAWEFVWGFCFSDRMDIGMAFVWGYRAWFFVDVVINIGLYKYGAKQIVNDSLRKNFKQLYFFSVIAWTVGLYFYVAEGYDTNVGTISAYILTVIMAFTYIMLFLSQTETKNFSYLVAWCKFLGNALFGCFAVLAFPDAYYLYTLIAVTVIFDAAYVVIFYRRRQLEAAGG